MRAVDRIAGFFSSSKNAIQILAFTCIFMAFTALPITEEVLTANTCENPRVLIVSSAVADAGILAAAAGDGVLVIEYDPVTTTMGSLLAEVRTDLKGRKASSIGFATHDYGEAKFYLTGKHTISLGSILSSKAERAFWRELGKLLAKDGRVDLLACRLAASDEGRLLLATLEKVAGVGFAASTNDTGNPVFGGDWVLEAGGIDAAALYFSPAELSQFSGLLISQVKKLIAPSGPDGDPYEWDGRADDEFGTAVAIDGDWAVVGAPNVDNDTDGDNDVTTEEPEPGEVNDFLWGAAYVYKRDQGGSNNWGFFKKLQKQLSVYSGGYISRNDHYGTAVAISGNTIVVCSPEAGTSWTTEYGNAEIFYKDQGGAENWGGVKWVTGSSTGGETQQFGRSCAIDGDYLVVGASNYSAGTDAAGAIYIFARNKNGANVWGEEAEIAGAYEYGNFGKAVDISGTTVIAGGPSDTSGTTAESGKAYIYTRSGTGTWPLQKTIPNPTPASMDRFGYAVAVDGDTAAIGAKLDDNTVGTNAGTVYIHYRNSGGAGNWGSVKELYGSAEYSNFGEAVDLSGDTLVVGKANYTHVYVHSRNEGSADNWGLIATLTGSDTVSNDSFGSAVSISGDDLIIGAGCADIGANTDQGAAYVFAFIPPTVGSPSATNVQATTATLGGNITDIGASNVTERGIYWSTTDGFADGTGTKVSQTGSWGSPGSYTVSVTGLSAGTTVYFKAFATNGDGTGYSSQGSFLTKPPAPTAQAATAILANGFTANWTAATGASSYKLFVATNISFTSPVTGYNPKSGISNNWEIVSGLLSGQAYYYKVVATNATGDSAESNTTGVTTATGPTVTSPTSSSIEATTATLGGNITDIGSSNVTERGIYWSTTNGFADGTGTKASELGSWGSTGTFTVSVTGLPAGTTVYFKAFATNSVGSNYSAQASFLTKPGQPTPSAASNIGATAFRANWSAVTGAASYKLSVATDSGMTSLLTGYNPMSGITNIYQDVTGLTPGTDYYYRVVATNATGDSMPSTVQPVTTIEPPLVDTPTSSSVETTTATLGGNVADIGASNVTERGIYWSTTDGFADGTGTKVSESGSWGSTGAFALSVTGLPAGTTVYFKAFATNGDGTAYTAQASFLTKPAATTALAATAIGGISFTANWNSVAGAESYRLDVSTGNTFATFVIGYQDLTVNGTSHNVSGLSTITTYYYRLRAVNATGTGTNSNVISLTTLAGFTVTFLAGPNGSLTGNTLQSNIPPAGNCTVVTAVPDSGYSFSGWTGDYIGSENPLTVTGVSADMTITANFARSLGGLRVNISPNAAVQDGAAWRRVGYSVWRASGTSENDIPPGNYSVEFKEIPGWIAPGNQSVTIYSNETTTTAAVYQQIGGNFSLTIENDSAVMVGIKWRIKGGSAAPGRLPDPSAVNKGGWLESGESITLTPGTYIVEFLPVPGWIHPEVELKIEPGKKATLKIEPVPFLVVDASDYDGDGVSDLACFCPSDQRWKVRNIFLQEYMILEKKFGREGAWPTPGDYNGDGVADLAFWRPSKGLWKVLRGIKVRNFGQECDIPVPADYDGDGKTDLALYRPSTGEWLIYESNAASPGAGTGVKVIVLGGDAQDLPVPGDYNGDGSAEVAVFNLKTRIWKLKGIDNLKFGLKGMIPVQADYNGDGRDELAAVNMAKGIWKIKGQGKVKIKSKAGNVPILCDIDADGIPEIAFYCCSTGTWHFDKGKIKHGSAGEVPLTR